MARFSPAKRKYARAKRARAVVFKAYRGQAAQLHMVQQKGAEAVTLLVLALKAQGDTIVVPKALIEEVVPAMKDYGYGIQTAEDGTMTIGLHYLPAIIQRATAQQTPPTEIAPA